MSGAFGARVLVTGGAGFIGSHVVDMLLEDGAAVLVVDDLSTGRLANLARWSDDPRLAIVRASVAEPLAPLVAPFAASRGPVTHAVLLAGQTSVAASLADPWPDLATNLGGTLHALAWAAAHGARQLVYASSAAVYGDGTADGPHALPIGEGALGRPLSPYGIHKLASELHLHAAARDRGTPALSLRLFNVYGPRQDPANPYCGVISRFIEAAAAGAPIEVHGDGAQTRDFVYVGDVAAAVCAALFGPPGSGEVYNIGAGVETSVRALAEQVRAACASASPIVTGPARPGDIRRSCADIGRARAALGYAPSVGLADGIARTVAWWRTDAAARSRPAPGPEIDGDADLDA